MIITLCGSARFEPEWHAWNERLTLTGHTVFGLAVYPSVKGGEKDWYSTETKALLDAAHLRKIEASEAIFVICGPNGAERYIGESTRREIAHAEAAGKLVYYSDQMPLFSREHFIAREMSLSI